MLTNLPALQATAEDLVYRSMPRIAYCPFTSSPAELTARGAFIGPESLDSV